MKVSPVRYEIRRLRQQIIENLDMNLNVIDEQLDRELSERLDMLLARQALGAVKKDTFGDMLLKSYA